MTPRDWEFAFEALVDPLLVLDTSGVSVGLNVAMRRLLKREDGALGMHWRTLLGTRSAEGVCPIQETYADRQSHTEELSLEHFPGTWQLTASPVLDAEGSLRALVVVMRDVTAATRQRAWMLEAARLAEIGQLAGGLAHEINTPLASIALRAESLLRLAQEPELLALPAFERFPRYLKTIDKEIFRCKRIITSLLEFARSGEAAVRPTELNPLVEGAIDLVSHALRPKGIRLEKQLDPGLATIPGDAAQLRQVALGLLMNAIEASHEGGAIRVATGSTTEHVYLEVSDEGPGIKPEDREAIFAPFYSANPSIPGTGLGLAVSRGVVAAHCGRIEVVAEPDAGSRFRVLLPRSRPRGGAPA